MTRKFYLSSFFCWMILFWLLFKIIGLATVSLRYSDSKNKQPLLSLTSSPLGTIYNVLLCCAVLASTYFSIPVLYNAEYVNKTTTTTIIELIQAAFGYLIISMVLLYYCTNRSTFESIGNCLICIERKLCLLRDQIDPKRILWILSVVYVLQTAFSITVLVTEHLAFHANPLVWLTDVLPATFTSWLLIQYFSVISLMNANFACANRVMQNFCRSTQTMENCSKYLTRSRRMFVNSSTIQSFLQLRNVYDDLFDVARKISDFYSLPILLSVPFLCLVILYNFYFLLQPLINSTEPLELIPLMSTAFWIIYCLYPLGLMTIQVTRLMGEIDKIGIFVHSLLNCAIDEETKSELKQFSLQLLHRGVKFTAYGYFDLNNSMFLSMLASMAGYLIILIQFQLVGPDCDCSCIEPKATPENGTVAEDEMRVTMIPARVRNQWTTGILHSVESEFINSVV